jgi:hypothetical protein
VRKKILLHVPAETIQSIHIKSQVQIISMYEPATEKPVILPAAVDLGGPEQQVVQNLFII